MIVETLSGLLAILIFALGVGTIWGLYYRNKYKVLFKAFEDARFSQVRAERELEDATKIAEHRKVTLDNVVDIILADKNQVPKAIKMMVVTETKK